MLLAALGPGPVGRLVGTGYVLGLAAVLSTAAARSGADTLGPAGIVTLSRAVLVGGVAALVADGLWRGDGSAPTLVAVASVALVLDAVDGRVARRSGTVSALGARFDMEVDAVLILVLSVHVAAGLGAWWVSAIGAMRYAWVAATRVLPWLRATLPPRYSAKVVAAVQGIVLVVAAADVLPRPSVVVLVGTALGLLVWSFGHDVRWLWRARRRPDPPAPVPGVPR